MRVETIETHWSWVFVTGSRAVKIKKAIRTEFADLRRVTARRRNCVEEVRLNRRLSHDVYLGTRPLLADVGGTVSFSTGAQAVDWASMMRRLAPERMLDRLIANGEVRAEDVTALVARLVAFYRDARGHDADVEAYRERLVGSVHANRDELTRPEYGLPVERIERICARQLDVLAARPWLDARRGALVEGHGDLRPEHVCLDGEPQVIDCLDFSRALRTQDAVDDLGFLALECTRLGAPRSARRSSTATGARAATMRRRPSCASTRACVRACARGSRSGTCASRRWHRIPCGVQRAEAYLAIAQELVEDGGMP